MLLTWFIVIRCHRFIYYFRFKNIYTICKHKKKTTFISLTVREWHNSVMCRLMIALARKHNVYQIIQIFWFLSLHFRCFGLDIWDYSHRANVVCCEIVRCESKSNDVIRYGWRRLIHSKNRKKRSYRWERIVE